MYKVCFDFLEMPPTTDRMFCHYVLDIDNFTAITDSVYYYNVSLYSDTVLCQK